MRKIINGKRYDTKTARFVGEASYGYGKDFAKERLFLKKTGEFFLWGSGNEVSGSQQIIPLTLEEAKTWAEEYMDGDDYEEVFGEVEESKDQISTWLPTSLKAEIDKLRKEKGSTIASIIKAGIKSLTEKN